MSGKSYGEPERDHAAEAAALKPTGGVKRHPGDALYDAPIDVLAPVKP